MLFTKTKDLKITAMILTLSLMLGACTFTPEQKEHGLLGAWWKNRSNSQPTVKPMVTSPSAGLKNDKPLPGAIQDTPSPKDLINGNKQASMLVNTVEDAKVQSGALKNAPTAVIKSAPAEASNTLASCPKISIDTKASKGKVGQASVEVAKASIDCKPKAGKFHSQIKISLKAQAPSANPHLKFAYALSLKNGDKIDIARQSFDAEIDVKKAGQAFYQNDTIEHQVKIQPGLSYSLSLD